jgi:hypothetical protein
MQGYQEFTESIRRAFSLPSDSELNITFTCDEPSSGEVTVGGEGEIARMCFVSACGVLAYDQN